MVKNIIGALLGGCAGLTCCAAGVYLVVAQSQAAMESGHYDATMTDVIAHGMGLYFIGKGFAIWALTLLGLRRAIPLVELAAPRG